MQRKAVRFAQAVVLTTIPLAVIWATSTPPVGRSGAPGDTTCASCHGGAGGGMSVVVSSTSGMTNYTAGASKHFTVTVSGSGGNAGFELTARPASNLSAGVAGNFVAGANTQVLCKVGTACAAGNPQYIRSATALATPAVFNFDWTAPSGSEDVTLYLASVVGYSGNSFMTTYTLKAGATAPPPTLTVSPASLTFAYQTGAAAPAAQTLSISGAAAAYTAAASGGTWLSVTPASGGVSGSATVSVNTAGLAAGTYSGSVTIMAAGSTGSPKSVPVTLNVTAATPTLTVSPASLNFAYQTGGTAPAAQTLSVSGVAGTFTAVASGGTWLSATQTPNSVSVAVKPTGLAAGSYSGSVTITAAGSAGSPKTIPVAFNVTTGAPALTVSPASLAFFYQSGGTMPAAQTLSISGAATTYTATSSGGTWLSVTPASGGSSGSASVTVNGVGLAAGTYSGSVTITATGSAGSPKTVPVTMTITAAAPTLTVSPSSLAFAWQTGGAAPAAQTLSVSGVATTFTAAASGGAWLSTTQTANGVSVAVNSTGLAAGSYSGSVTIASPGSINGTQVVAVSLTVSVPPATSLQVAPATLAFSYAIGDSAPLPYVINITNSAASMNYSAAASSGVWLSVSPSAGTTPGALFVAVQPAGLTIGTYKAFITITPVNSPGNAQVVPVTLAVTNTGATQCPAQPGR